MSQETGITPVWQETHLWESEILHDPSEIPTRDSGQVFLTLHPASSKVLLCSPFLFLNWPPIPVWEATFPELPDTFGGPAVPTLSSPWPRAKQPYSPCRTYSSLSPGGLSSQAPLQRGHRSSVYHTLLFLRQRVIRVFCLPPHPPNMVFPRA